MATRLKPIAHDERLSLVEHLDELRTRIIICVVAFTVVAGICLWQDDAILDFVNRPLEKAQTSKPCDETRDPLEQSACWQDAQKRVNERIAETARSLAGGAADQPVLRAQAGRWPRRRRRRPWRARAGRPGGRSRSGSVSRSPRR